jgi:hypothetical protein
LLRGPRLKTPGPLIRRRGRHLYVLSVTVDHLGQVMIGVTPVSARRVVAHLKRVRLRVGR